MRRSMMNRATCTTEYFSFITASRTDVSSARNDAICPGLRAAAPSESISGGEWCKNLANAAKHCSFTSVPTDAVVTCIRDATTFAP